MRLMSARLPARLPACLPACLQLVEKLVVMCCAHPAAYRDPQRFDAKQLHRWGGGHAACTLAGSMPVAGCQA
jgi:hypothetical protein